MGKNSSKSALLAQIPGSFLANSVKLIRKRTPPSDAVESKGLFSTFQLPEARMGATSPHIKAGTGNLFTTIEIGEPFIWHKYNGQSNKETQPDVTPTFCIVPENFRAKDTAPPLQPQAKSRETSLPVNQPQSSEMQASPGVTITEANGHVSTPLVSTIFNSKRTSNSGFFDKSDNTAAVMGFLEIEAQNNNFPIVRLLLINLKNKEVVLSDAVLNCLLIMQKERYCLKFLSDSFSQQLLDYPKRKEEQFIKSLLV